MNEYFVVEFFKFDKWNLVTKFKEQVMILLLLTSQRLFDSITKSISFFVIVEKVAGFLLRNHLTADFEMLYFNADGKQGSVWERGKMYC